MDILLCVKHLVSNKYFEVAKALPMQYVLLRVDEPDQCFLGLQVLVHRVWPDSFHYNTES